MKDSIWNEFSSQIYEPKILYRTKTFEDRCRMFCFNQGGIVSAENNGGVITANGHSFAEEDKKTDNCNFAILSSINFTEPFDDPTSYASKHCDSYRLQIKYLKPLEQYADNYYNQNIKMKG